MSAGSSLLGEAGERLPFSDAKLLQLFSAYTLTCLFVLLRVSSFCKSLTEREIKNSSRGVRGGPTDSSPTVHPRGAEGSPLASEQSAVLCVAIPAALMNFSLASSSSVRGQSHQIISNQ